MDGSTLYDVFEHHSTHRHATRFIRVEEFHYCITSYNDYLSITTPLVSHANQRWLIWRKEIKEVRRRLVEFLHLQWGLSCIIVYFGCYRYLAS